MAQGLMVQPDTPAKNRETLVRYFPTLTYFTLTFTVAICLKFFRRPLWRLDECASRYATSSRIHQQRRHLVFIIYKLPVNSRRRNSETFRPLITDTKLTDTRKQFADLKIWAKHCKFKSNEHLINFLLFFGMESYFKEWKLSQSWKRET